MRHGVMTVVFLVMTIGAVTAGPAEGASVRVMPTAGLGTRSIIVGGRARLYHVATADAPLKFEYEGPLSVRVLSRLLMTEDVPSDTAHYGIHLRIDGTIVQTLREPAGVSNNAELPGGGPVGALRRSIVRLPAGKHSVEVYADRPGIRVALRLFEGDGAPDRTQWLHCTPEPGARAVRLHVRDSEVIYYRAKTGRAITLQINGPLQLKIRTRIDFLADPPDDGSIPAIRDYALLVSIDGDPARRFELRGRRSSVSSYPELPEIVPATGRSVIVDVPEGRHWVGATLDCESIESGSVRFQIPESAVTNGV